MVITEKKGDITFYKDEEGKLFQQYKTGDIFPVREGEIVYKTLKTLGDFSLKYNLNGLYGFAIFKGDELFEKNYWTAKYALNWFMKFYLVDKKYHSEDYIVSVSSKSANNKTTVR